jgi:hypothetical protein
VERPAGRTQSFKILYDDRLRFVREVPADGIEVEAPKG